MVNLDVLAPGIRVKIVDEWKPGCGQNVNGLMDKYLGQIVTILDVDVDEDTATLSFLRNKTQQVSEVML